MEAFSLDVTEWAEMQFGACELGDRRRNRRLVKFAAQVASNPSASTPDQTRTWADCKGAYRLMDCNDVSFDALIAPHCRHTRNRMSASGCSLIIHDTTEVSFSAQREPIDGLGPTGNGVRQGFHLHTALKISADSQEVLGVAGQLLFYRRPVPKRVGGKRETAAEAKRRPRESEVWRRLIERVGPAPEGQTYVHVCDRGADNYEVFAQACLTGTGWIVRAAQLHRKLRPVVPETPHDPWAGEVTTVETLLATQPFTDGYDVHVPATKTSPVRTARLQLRWVSLWMPRPKPCSRWAREHAPEFLWMTAVEVFETNPPRGAEPLRWVLYTHEEVETAEAARRVAEDYARRPLVEDYHKGIKTGCGVEERQYATAERLERITAVLSVTAVRLMQIRAVARVEPERPASDVAPKEWVDTLHAHLRAHAPKYAQLWPREKWTISQFMRRLAMLGGFLGRKRDGQPGWITLWRGVTKLLLLIEGRRLARQKCG